MPKFGSSVLSTLYYRQILSVLPAVSSVLLSPELTKCHCGWKTTKETKIWQRSSVKPLATWQLAQNGSMTIEIYSEDDCGKPDSIETEATTLPKGDLYAAFLQM